MAVTKRTFMSRPKIMALPGPERERRWKQHLMSEGGLRDQRIPQRVRGRGDYFSDATAWADRQLARIPKGGLASAGRALGGVPGEAIGSLISQLTGRGDYNIKRNSLIVDGHILNPGAVSFSPTGAAAIRVQKREFIANVVSPLVPTDFTQQQYRLQCTDKSTFPWLSAIAEHFTEWELHGAIVSYETTSSNYAANMALGTIAIATQYNANELPYSNMEQMLQAAYHSRANPSESLMHGIECDPELQASEHLFTRRFGSAGPPNLYDHGVVSVATEGLPAAAGTIIGRLFITYDIELNLPALPADDLHVMKSSGMYGGFGSTTEPPMGSTLAIVGNYITPAQGGLSFGTATSDNVMSLMPSNGPLARPQLPPADQASLVAWMSDSSVVAGGQYLSFAHSGKYLLELTVIGTTAPGLFVDMTTVTQDVSIEEYNTIVSTALTHYFRYGITCVSADQSVQLVRQNAAATVTWSILTVC